MAIQLGKRYRCLITGFAGVATGHVEYISGCTQTLLAPGVDKDGKLQDSNWFDDQRLVALSEPQIVLDNSATPGPDAPAPKR